METEAGENVHDVKKKMEMDLYYNKNNKGILNGRFCLIKTLGEGGTASVKLAWDLQSEDFCAVKILLKLGPKDMQMVQTEVETMSKIKHPNVLEMIQYGQG